VNHCSPPSYSTVAGRRSLWHSVSREATLNDKQTTPSQIPQVYDIDDVVLVVEAMARGVPQVDLVNELGLSDRHLNYRIAAATTLGWLTRESGGTIRPTADGKLLAAESRQSVRGELIWRAVYESPLAAYLPDASDESIAFNRKSVAEKLTRNLGLSESTALHRAGALGRWFERLQLVHSSRSLSSSNTSTFPATPQGSPLIKAVARKLGAGKSNPKGSAASEPDEGVSSPLDPKDWPAWLRTERDVERLFTLLGFTTERIHVLGRQIDIIAERQNAFEPERWSIEVTCAYIDVDKGSKDGQKLQLAMKQRRTRGMLVSTKGFSGGQAETLRELGIVCLTYGELEQRVINLRQYAAVCIEELKHKSVNNEIGFDPTTFVPSTVRVHASNSNAEASEPQDAISWVKGVVERDVGIVGALLGNLGTGKTSLLQYVHLKMLEEYWANPSTAVVPLYVPLSRYKHHSGRVDSMLHEILTECGIDNYPTKLIKHLASTGRLVFFFDGLDEVHPIQSIDDVVTTATNLLTYVGRNARAVISSRTHMFATSDQEFAIFGPYERARIKRVAQLLYDLLSDRATTEIAYIQPFSREQVVSYLRLACGDDFNAVHTKIEQIYGFREMATTPVLLAMMRRTVPKILRDGHGFGKHPVLDLYRDYTERWIARDEGRAQLSSEQRMRLSEALAVSLISRDEYSATWEEIAGLLHADPAWSARPISESAAEMDVRNSTFLVREGDRHFRFAHRSIMEFFSARESLRRLQRGETASVTQSDGQAQFLAMMTNELWHQSETALPFGKHEFELDAWADAKHLGLLSAATLAQPSHEKSKLPFRQVRISGTKCGQLRFRHLAASDITINVEALEFLRFDASFVERLHVKSERAGGIEFYDTTVQGSTIDLSIESWSRVAIFPEGRDAAAATLGLPTGFDSAARFAELPGCEARIGGRTWKLGITVLGLIAAIGQKLLGKAKVNIENWAKGPWATELGRVLPQLRNRGIVDQDSSRRPHQLSLSSKGIQLFGALKASPIDSQTELVFLATLVRE
jgi:hypothetical protein